MDLASLRRKENLARLYADVHSLYSSKTKVAARSVQHDCTAGIDHMCLEEYFVNDAVSVHDVEFGWWEVKSPIAEILIYNINSMVFKCRIETGTLEDFAENPNGVNQVGKGRENSKVGHEGGVVIILKRTRIGNMLDDVNKEL
jgi:hypothetical protein